MKGKGRILIFTGDGKGKTTAALGMALRASGHGMQTLILQFIKANRSIGELTAIQYLPGVDIIQAGRGFISSTKGPPFAEHRQAAQEALKKATEAIQSRRYQLIILDEICTAISRGLVGEDQVIDLIHQETEERCLVLTGKGASDRLISEADTVTEMRALKHGLPQGWVAQKGVEY